MRRMSARVDNAVGQLKLKEWSARILDIQWKFIGRLKSLPSSSWPSRAAFWQPLRIDDPSCAFLPHRAQGRPFTRWDDKVTKFSCEHFGEIWQDVPHLSFLRALPKFVSGLSGHDVLVRDPTPLNVPSRTTNARMHGVSVPFFQVRNDNWW